VLQKKGGGAKNRCRRVEPSERMQKKPSSLPVGEENAERIFSTRLWGTHRQGGEILEKKRKEKRLRSSAQNSTEEKGLSEKATGDHSGQFAEKGGAWGGGGGLKKKNPSQLGTYPSRQGESSAKDLSKRTFPTKKEFLPWTPLKRHRRRRSLKEWYVVCAKEINDRRGKVVLEGRGEKKRKKVEQSCAPGPSEKRKRRVWLTGLLFKKEGLRTDVRGG